MGNVAPETKRSVYGNIIVKLPSDNLEEWRTKCTIGPPFKKIRETEIWTIYRHTTDFRQPFYCILLLRDVWSAKIAGVESPFFSLSLIPNLVLSIEDVDRFKTDVLEKNMHCLRGVNEELKIAVYGIESSPMFTPPSYLKWWTDNPNRCNQTKPEYYLLEIKWKSLIASNVVSKIIYGMVNGLNLYRSNPITTGSIETNNMETSIAIGTDEDGKEAMQNHLEQETTAIETASFRKQIHPHGIGCVLGEETDEEGKAHCVICGRYSR